jgi:8-oxo-dGTP diphosphatase
VNNIGYDDKVPKGTAYVCGFAFDARDHVTLIRKQRPTWQKGKLNGVGGKVETVDTTPIGGTPRTIARESSRHAMSREFLEETGVFVPVEDWILYHREQWPNGNSVDFFTCRLPPGTRPETKTDELVQSVYWRIRNNHDWPRDQFMYNLHYLIPMAFCHLNGHPADLPFHKE